MTSHAGRQPIRVVIADDNAGYRASLAIVIALDGDIEVVGEAGDGYEALDLAVSAHPDVVVIDNRMPRLSGLEASRAITAKVDEVRVLMLTMSDLDVDLESAIDAGVQGYLFKDSPGEEVAEAIRAVMNGMSVFPPRTVRSHLDRT